MKTILTAIFLLCLFLPGSSQTNQPDRQYRLDSLWDIWQDKTRPDTIRLSALYKYTWDGYLFSQPDSAFYFAHLGYELAESKGLKKQMAEALRIQGVSFHLRGDYPKALDYYQRGLALFEELGDKKGMSNSLNNIGIMYADQGDYPKSLEYYQRVLAIIEKTGDKQGIAGALNNIGLIYNTQGNNPKALDYYQRSLAIREELGDKQGIAPQLNNIGLIYKNQGDYPKALEYHQRSLAIYEELGEIRRIANTLSNIGDIYREQGDYPGALDYFQRSLAIRGKIGDKKGITNSLSSIGIIYYDQGNYPKALDYYQRSLAISEELGDKKGMALSLGNIGLAYKKQGDYPEALGYCQRGLVLAESINILKEQKLACQCLFDTYKAMGNGNEALVYLEKMRSIEDSLQVEETAKKLQQMEFAKQMLADSLANEQAKLEAQLAYEADVQKKQRSRNLFLGGGLLALLLAAGFYSRWRYVKKSQVDISREKDRSENLLLNILPAEIAEELKEKGHADARDFDMVSILFTDFKEFTRTSEKLSAHELVTEINVCFEAFDTICEKHGIEKIKTIGDAYMAAGGLPIPDQAAARNTVMAALEMQAFILARKAAKSAKGELAFDMRVGIHTGPVVAGIVGVKKFQYDIWGDTVNTASRMETNGEIGKVNVSERTYELIKHDPEFTFEPRGKLEVKGKGEVEMYFVSHRPTPIGGSPSSAPTSDSVQGQ